MSGEAEKGRLRFVFAILQLTQNGPSGSRLRLAEALGRRGHHVTVLTFSRRQGRAVPPGVEVAVIDHPVDGFPKSRAERLRVAVSLRRWLAAELENGPVDFFSSSLTSTDRLVHLAGLSGVRHWIHITISKLLGDRGSLWDRRRRRRLHRRIYDGARVIGVSQGVLDDLALFGAHPAEADLVTNAYDIAGLRRAAEAVAEGLPSAPYVIHAGRFAHPKRHDLLFDAFKQSGIPHRLVLLTADRPELRALIAEHSLEGRVAVAGFQQNPYPWMKRAAALVLSSDSEGFPNVLAESLVVGTPVISTDCPAGPSEILTGPYARWLSPMGDAPALAANLALVVAEPYAIEPWLIERFSIEAALDRLEAIARRGPRPGIGRMNWLDRFRSQAQRLGRIGKA